MSSRSGKKRPWDQDKRYLQAAEFYLDFGHKMSLTRCMMAAYFTADEANDDTKKKRVRRMFMAMDHLQQKEEKQQTTVKTTVTPSSSTPIFPHSRHEKELPEPKQIRLNSAQKTTDRHNKELLDSRTNKAFIEACLLFQEEQSNPIGQRRSANSIVEFINKKFDA